MQFNSLAPEQIGKKYQWIFLKWYIDQNWISNNIFIDVYAIFYGLFDD